MYLHSYVNICLCMNHTKYMYLYVYVNTCKYMYIYILYHTKYMYFASYKMQNNTYKYINTCSWGTQIFEHIAFYYLLYF